MIIEVDELKGFQSKGKPEYFNLFLKKFLLPILDQKHVSRSTDSFIMDSFSEIINAAEDLS